MYNPLTTVKRGVKKITQNPNLVYYGTGLVTGMLIVGVYQQGMAPIVVSIAKDRAQFLADNPGEVIVWLRPGRDVVVRSLTA
jgi:hypothetical protein